MDELLIGQPASLLVLIYEGSFYDLEKGGWVVGRLVGPSVGWSVTVSQSVSQLVIQSDAL